MIVFFKGLVESLLKIGTWGGNSIRQVFESLSCPLVYYSYLSASTGFSFEARQAG